MTAEDRWLKNIDRELRSLGERVAAPGLVEAVLEIVEKQVSRHLESLTEDEAQSATNKIIHRCRFCNMTNILYTKDFKPKIRFCQNCKRKFRA